MAKTKRMIAENLKEVDIVIELLDSRIPISSRNPDIVAMCANKPILTLLNKTSLADPDVTREWVRYFKSNGGGALPIDCITGDGVSQIIREVRDILSEKIKRYEEKGMSGRRLRAMIVGIPNVGKSSLINKLCGSARAKVEDRPGVTRDKQWITTKFQLDLLDTPGVLWPKFDDRIIGENLAITGAVRDGVLDTVEIAGILCERLYAVARDKLLARYKIAQEDAARLLEEAITEDSFKYDLLSLIGRKRGFLISGGEVDLDHAAAVVLDEFRGAKIGRISLEGANEKD